MVNLNQNKRRPTSRVSPVHSEKKHKSQESSTHSRMRERLRLREIELKIYRELGDSNNKKLKLSVLLEKLMRYILKALETDSGTLYLLDKVTNQLIFKVVQGPMASKLKGLRIKPGKGIVGRVVRTGKPYISSNLTNDKEWLGLKGDYSQRNMLAVPISVRDSVVGVIAVLNKVGEKQFTSNDLDILVSLSNHFSTILERRELFSKLDVKVKQSEALQHVSNLLVSSLNEKIVKERAMKAVTELIAAEVGSLLMVDWDKKELFFEVALGEKGSKVKEIRLKVGEGFAGWVAKHGTPLLVDDVTKDKRFQGKVDKKSSFVTRSMLCVPVKLRGKTIGVLQAVNKIAGNFTKDDKELLELFSNQVAIALENARLYHEIRETFYNTSEALAEAIEKRDPYTGGHTKRVLGYSLAIGKELEMDSDSLERLKLSAVLHDIGKIGVDDAVLRKQARLDDDEVNMMKNHPRFGADILKHIPQLKHIVPGMYYHHERIDGKGYPEGIKGKKIPLEARIISVADTYDAMTSTRPYRKGLSPAVALKELKKHSGTQFEKKIVLAFLKAYKNGEIQE